jgi:protein TonB
VKIVKVAPRQFDAGKLIAPKEIPKQIAQITEEDLPPSASSGGVVGGVPGGVPGGVAGGVIGGIIGGIPSAAPPPAVKEVKSVTPQRVRVGGNVQAANLIKKVTPVYPPLAKQARISGQVRFTAIIGKDGTIQNLQLVSGHPLLVAAAQEAVKQWIYKPTLLNGEPVEVITQIDVNFTLSQ